VENFPESALKSDYYPDTFPAMASPKLSASALHPWPHSLLVEDAADCLGFEREGGYSARAARMATRDMLADRARELGYPEREIDSVVDAALAAAST
jgi:hypothetical protein